MLIVYGPCDKLDQAMAMANDVIIASQANRAAADVDTNGIDQPVPRNRRGRQPPREPEQPILPGMPPGLPAAS